MADAQFWIQRKGEFNALSEYEYAHVPDPADGRRLQAWGDYSNTQAPRFGSWTLNESFSADQRGSFDETATLAGRALNPPARVKPRDFWLHSLFRFLLEIEGTRTDSGHLGVGDPARVGIIRDVCAASAQFCSFLATEAMERKSRQSEANAIESVRTDARKMIAQGATHREVCHRLKDRPRPPHVEWRHLTWEQAFRNPKYESAVRKWLSKNCRR
jgi:hypothetical protein